MRITAKVDYAVRAAAELAAAPPGPVKGDVIAERQGIPAKFLENILADLRRSGLVSSQRGADGGYWLAADAATVSVADIAAGRLPPPIDELLSEPDAWVRR